MYLKFALRTLVSAVLLIATGICAAAQTRVALVIGNSEYQAVSRLPNPVNDADAVSSVLTGLGFDVVKLVDLSKASFETALADFTDKAATSDIALVYYAGHGIEVNGQNYLIPVDARLDADTRVRFEAVSLDDVLASIQSARKLKIVLLDACRNNPFATSMKRSLGKRSVGRGLAPVEAEDNILISYAAAPGQEAGDGVDGNSPYAKALVKHLATPGYEISKLFRLVRDDVRAATNGQQTPYLDLSLPGEDIYLNQTDVGQSSNEGAKPEAPMDNKSEEVDRNEEARRALELIGERATAEELDVIADHFRGTFYGKLAERRAAALRATRDEEKRKEEAQQRQEQERRREEASLQGGANDARIPVEENGEAIVERITTSPWVVITGSYSREQRSKAYARARLLKEEGYRAQIIDSRYYANLKDGLLVVVIDAGTRANALRIAEELKRVVRDAYAKRAY